MPTSNYTAPVSVIIPCYRCRDTVERALTSALNQTSSPAEVLLIDDGSGDGTLDFLHQLEQLHKSRVKVIALKENGGPGKARNAGWEVASQPWLAFLDADDVWHPRKLEIQLGWLNSHPNVLLCGHDTRYATGPIDLPVEVEPHVTKLTPWKMLVSNRLPTRSVMVRKELSFRFSGREVTEDYLLWLEIIFSGIPAYRLETCLAFSLRPDFSPGGYSGQLWIHEKRELNALRTLHAKGLLSWPTMLVTQGWSFIKFLRRQWLMGRNQ